MNPVASVNDYGNDKNTRIVSKSIAVEFFLLSPDEGVRENEKL